MRCEHQALRADNSDPYRWPCRALAKRSAIVSLTLAVLASTATMMPRTAAADATSARLPHQITIVVPFSPGGSNDVFARALGQKISTKLGLTIIVDNRPGAGGVIGSGLVARAEPDGSTLLLSSASFATNAAVQSKLPYDPIKSFAPVALVSRGPMLLTVARDTPFRSTADYLAAARKPGNPLNYGSAGVGSIGQMGSELLHAMTGTHVVHLPYKGIANAATDMAGGNLQMLITTPASVSGPLKQGTIRPLAVTSEKRSPLIPDLPSISETVPGYSVDVWWGVFAPAGTPKAIVDRLNAEIREAGHTPELKTLYAAEGTEAGDLDAAEFAGFVTEEVAKWARLARERNIRID